MLTDKFLCLFLCIIKTIRNFIHFRINYEDNIIIWSVISGDIGFFALILFL